jgi:uncharacterized OB-fold protein
MTEAGAGYARPLPAMRGLAEEFYRWCGEGELRFQRCTECGSWRHVPREMCAECGARCWEWAPSSGRGTLFTWTVVARALHPDFAEDVPYAPAVIELDEGVRLLSQVVDCPIEELEMGMPVEVVFEKVTEEVALPRFRRVQTGRAGSSRTE